MIVSVGLSRSPGKRDLHRQDPARAGTSFTQGEYIGSVAAPAMEVTHP
jgi:hypothetical protein